MRLTFGCTIRALFTFLLVFGLSLPSAFAVVYITSPGNGATVSGPVPIATVAQEGSSFHLEIWDNGNKLGDFFSSAVQIAPAMPQGRHTMTVLAVDPNGQVINQSTVVYNVATGQTPPPAPPPPASPSGSGGVNIISPAPGATSISAVQIAASDNDGSVAALQIWDNGYKLGQVSSQNVSGVYVLPSGSHVLTVLAVDNNGSTLSSNSVNYTVAEDCSQAGNAPCDLDQIGINNAQNQCNPQIESAWVANPCGGGVQGNGGSVPKSTLIESVQENGGLADQNNRTLNGNSLHLEEVQGGSWSNVLFRGTTPSPLPAQAVNSHWRMDEYVYLPNPAAHQAFEVDAQYTANGIWSKFYTECAFNINDGTGYWAVFDSNTGGWIFLNGQVQGGQRPPVVPCNRSQFAQPWPGSSNPSFTGWHHIAWTFVRNPNGTVTFQTLTFDAVTTQVNFTPNSGTGGNVSDNGNYSALVQLDGMNNDSGQNSVVEAYVSEVHLTSTP
jgi:hypothetical protein